MKRRNKGTLPSAKQPKGECEAGEAPPQFLHGVKCHVHPANFGLVRHRIFENHVTRYGGELVPSLPETSEMAYHVVFEESVDEEKLKRLVETSRLPNSVFLRCTWLVDCIKAKAKAATEGHLIVSMNSVEEQRSKERSREVGATQSAETERTCLEEDVKMQAKETNKTQVEGTDRIHLREIDIPKSRSQRTISNLGLNENPESQDISYNGDPLARATVLPTSHEQREDLETHASTIVTRDGKKVEDERAPKNCTVNEALANKSVTYKRETGASGKDNLESLIRPFPKNLQVIYQLSVFCSSYVMFPT